MILDPLPARIRRRVVAEQLREQRHTLGDVRVVVTGDHGDVERPERELVELAARELELAAHRQVRDVAGAQHVLDALRVEILDHVLERGHVIVAAAARQEVHRADPALVHELDPAPAVV